MRVQHITLNSPHFLTADPGYPGSGGQVKTTDYTLLGVCNQIQTLLHKDLLQPVIGFNGQHTGRQVPPPPQKDYEVFLQNDYEVFVQNDYEVFVQNDYEVFLQNDYEVFLQNDYEVFLQNDYEVFVQNDY